jgi:hypothetical protein
MPRPIRIRINKGTIVPTKKQIKHEERTDWKTVGVIDYSESPGIFSYLGNGSISNDAQFAKLLIENFGPGKYTCLFWRKGMKGFRRLIMLKCTSEGFKQMKAEVYKNRRKKLEKEQDLERLKQELKEFDNPHEQEALLDEIKKTEESLDYESRDQWPYPYLESLQQRYKFHDYEGVEFTEEDQEEPNNEEVVQETGFWSTPIEQEDVEQEPEKEPEYSLW